MTDFAQRTVTASAPSPLVDAGGGPVLLNNTDAANTVWLGDDPFDTTATGDNVAPLPPLGSAVFDGKSPVYGITASGTALVSVYPGGLNFFQLLNLLVKTLRITGAAGNGVFVYSAAPGAGDLVESIAATDALDPFANEFFNGFTSYSGNGALDLFMSLRQAGLFWGTNSNGPGGTGALAIAGPIGLRIQNQLTATDPNNPGTNETWHTAVAQNGWGTGLRYRLRAENEVSLSADILTAGTATSGTVIASVPAAYRPAGERRVNYSTAGSTAINAISGLAVQPGGNIILAGALPTGTTSISLEGRYSLD